MQKYNSIEKYRLYLYYIYIFRIYHLYVEPFSYATSKYLHSRNNITDEFNSLPRVFPLKRFYNKSIYDERQTEKFSETESPLLKFPTRAEFSPSPQPPRTHTQTHTLNFCIRCIVCMRECIFIIFARRYCFSHVRN